MREAEAVSDTLDSGAKAYQRVQRQRRRAESLRSVFLTKYLVKMIRTQAVVKIIHKHVTPNAIDGCYPKMTQVGQFYDTGETYVVLEFTLHCGDQKLLAI